MPMKVTHARLGMLETDLANHRILMHLYNARYQQRDEVDPYDLRRMRDGINVAEETSPISLEDLYDKEKRRASRSMLSLEQLLDQLKDDDPKMRSSSRTEINKRFSFPIACLVFALVGVPLGITAHRRETSFGFAASLVIGVFYFLFIIVADTLRANGQPPPSASRLVPKRALSGPGMVAVPPHESPVGGAGGLQ